VALVYHLVGEPAGDPRRELLPAMGTRLFGEQLRLLASRYRLVTASELPRAVRARAPGTPFPVAITFDDDLRSHVEVVLQPLAERAAAATFYLTGHSLDGPSTFWWDRLQQAVDSGLDLESLELESARRRGTIHEIGKEIERLPPAERRKVDAKLNDLVADDARADGLARADVARLSSAGHEIGFHTRAHDRLPELDDTSLEHALRAGRSELEEVSGRRLTSISYPHGRADIRVADAARAAGFETGYTGDPAPVTASTDELLLGRLSPSYDSVGELVFDVAWAMLRAGPSR